MDGVEGIASEIRSAIDQFKAEYHHGFARVRPIARRWLRGNGDLPVALASRVSAVLQDWGAGAQKAPEVKDLPIIERTLIEARSLLVAVEELDLFTIDREVSASRRPEIDRLVLEALWALTPCFELHGQKGKRGQAAEVRAHSVTYPSKLLMLLTGRIVGLDSNVRAGIGDLFLMRGFTSTQFLLPRLDDPRATQAERISQVFWRSAEFLGENEEEVCRGVEASSQPELISQYDAPARVMDVLLFVAGKGALKERKAGK